MSDTNRHSLAPQAESRVRPDEVPRILLVEDSPAEAELFCQALTIALESVAPQFGLLHPIVTVLHDATEAIEFLRTQSRTVPSVLPTLMVLDLDLPGETSLPFLRIVRGDSQLNTLPIVAMGWAEDEYSNHQLSGLGVSEYVIKPLRFADLIDLANRLCWTFLLPSTNLQRPLKLP